MADEPRVGWEDSSERNRIDGAIEATKSALQSTMIELTECRRIAGDVRTDTADDLRMAHGYLKDAQDKLREQVPFRRNVPRPL